MVSGHPYEVRFTKRMRRIVLWVVAGALLMAPFRGGAASAADRPTAPKLLPENTLVYIRVADAQDTMAKIRETSLGRMLQDEQVRPLVQSLYQSAKDAFSNVENQVGLSLDELLSIPQGELCFAVVGAAQGPPAVVLIADVGDRMAQADILINRAVEEAGNNGAGLSSESHAGTDLTVLTPRRGGQLVLFTRDQTIVITSSIDLSKSLLDVWNGAADVRTLADNRTFTAIMSQSVGTKEERPQISWFFDPIPLVRNVTRGNLTAQAGLALLSPLGLDDLEGVGGSVVLAAEEFDTIGHFHLLLKNPRRAVLKMLALTSGDMEPESWVPKDVVSYMTAYWDVQTTFSEWATLYDMIRLEEGAFANLVKRRFSDRLGVDVQSEVLPLLAGRFTLITSVERPVKLNSQVTGVGIKLTDAEAGRKVLEKLASQFPEVFERKNYGANVYYRLGGQRRVPPNFDEAMMRLPEPAVMILGDYLILSDSAKLLETLIVTKSTPDASLASDLEYKLVASRIQRHAGNRAPGLISFQRPEESLRALYELATAETTRNRLQQAGENNGFFRVLDQAMTEHPLPPFSALAKYLAPSGSMLINDETGFHYISFGLRRD